MAIGILCAGVPAFAQSGSCSAIGGLPSVSFTTDDGATFVVNRRPLTPGTGTFGVAALASPGAVVAEHLGNIYASSSSGCRFSPLGRVDTSPLRIAAGVGTQAWAWGFFAGHGVWRIDVGATDGNRVVRRADLPAEVMTLAGDPANANHIRAVGRDGSIYDSSDSAATWTSVGRRAPVQPLVYFAAVNPHDLDNVMIGVVTDGVWTTTDGGASWVQARGLSTGGGVNGFNGVFAPADAGVAWVMALDLAQNLAGDPSEGRHIYRSVDKGLTFEPVVDHGNGITLINGPVLEPHPQDADVLYFPFGSRFSGGMWLYRYDDATRTTTWNFNSSWVSPRALSIAGWAPATVFAGFEGQ